MIAPIRAVCEHRGGVVGMAAVGLEVEVRPLLRRNGGHGVNGVKLVDGGIEDGRLYVIGARPAAR